MRHGGPYGPFLLLFTLARWCTAAVPGEAELVARLNAGNRADVLEAARQLGDLGSVPGLEAIATQDDPGLVDAYAANLRYLSREEWSPAQAATLVALLTRSGFRPRTYSRIAFAIAHANPPHGVDSDLYQALPLLPDDGRTAIVLLLADHRHPGVVPYLRAIVRTPDGLAAGACEALAKIGTEAAVAATIDCLGDLARGRRDAVPRALENLMQAPADVPIDLRAVRGALPSQLDGYVARGYARLVGARQDAGGVPELLLLLSRDVGRYYPSETPVLDAVLAFDDPEVWKQARAELERLHATGQLEEKTYEASATRLDRAIANPDPLLKQHRDERANRALRAAWDVLEARHRVTDGPRHTDLERWVAEVTAYVEDGRRLLAEHPDAPEGRTLRSALAQHELRLSAVVRFTLRQPRRVLPLYEALFADLSSSADDGSAELRAFFLGDLYQFDLGDRAKAIEAYEDGLAHLAAAPQGDKDWAVAVRMWWREWFTAEITYLRTGQPFRGPVTIERIEHFTTTLFLLGMVGVGGGPLAARIPESNERDPSSHVFSAEELRDLPSSHLTLLGTLSAASLLPDADGVVAYLERNDPGGYWTACIVGLTLLAERAGLPESGTGVSGHGYGFLPGVMRKPGAPEPAFITAVDRLRARRSLSLPPPDVRKASPQQTWTLFLDSLRAGDVETAISCFTERRRKQLAPWLRQLSREELRKLADSHVGFALTGQIDKEYQEAAVTRQFPTERRLGLAYFVSRNGEWLVDEGP